MSPAAVHPHYAAVLALLRTITNMGGHDGEVGSAPASDPDGRTHPYWVLYPGPGMPFASSLDGVTRDLDWSFQVTVAAGDVQRTLWALDKVNAVLLDAEPVVAGRSVRIRADDDAGPVRRDDDVHPPRFFIPAMYRALSVPA